MEENMTPQKRTVLDYDDLRKMVPFFDGKPRLVKSLMKFLALDKVNWAHDHNCDVTGVPFVEGLLRDFDIKLKIDNEEVLKNLPEGGFITVSNHTFGALDGIILIKLIGQYRPKFKVIVNRILNYIWAMRPNFITVDQSASKDPEKQRVSIQGIRNAMMQVKRGEPLGLFPAGAMSKINHKFELQDREWQITMLQLIKKLNVPVIPIYFHGSNSWLFNIMGVVCWQLRSLMLPNEVFHKTHSTFHISIGNPISPEKQNEFSTPEELGRYLREQTYALKKQYKK